MTQEATEAEVELLRSRLAESDGRTVGKAFTPCFTNSSVIPLISSFYLLIALEAKLEELCSRLGRVLDFVGAHGSFLAGRLDDAPHCVRGVVGLGACQGVVTALLVTCEGHRSSFGLTG
jgi:hypothetical protein